jgi:hypothetical protein
MTSLAEKDDAAFLDARSIFNGMDEPIFTDDVHFRTVRGYETTRARHRIGVARRCAWRCWTTKAPVTPERPTSCASRPIDWDFIWQGHQEIMSTFAAEGHRVLFLENTGVRAP